MTSLLVILHNLMSSYSKVNFTFVTETTEQGTHDGKAGREGQEEGGREEDSLDDIVIEMERPPTAEDSSFEEITSPESHVTQETGHMTTSVKVGIEEPTLLLEGTLILTPRRGSDTEIEIDKREEVHRRSFAVGDSVGGVSYSSSAHWHLPHHKSLPLAIIVSSSSHHYVMMT